MLAYAVVLISCFLLLLLARVLAKMQQRQMALVCVFILTAFATLRGYVGTDTYAYHLMYEDNVGQDVSYLLDIVEPLFALLLKFIAQFTDDSFAFVIAIGLLQGLLVMRLMQSSRSPVDFLMIYLAIFYLSFHFNILRAGTAILFLMLAGRSSRDDASQVKFYFFGIAAVLSHYSALLAFVPMLAWRLNNPKAIVAGVLIVLAGTLYLFLVSKDVIADKYFIYTDLLAPDVSTGSSMSFILGLPLYLAIFASALRRQNAIGLTLLLCIWIGLRWLTSIYTLAGRVEMIANAMLLFYMIEVPAIGWQKRLRTISVTGLTVMWIIGALMGLASEDAIMSNLGIVNEVYLSSPFTPYRFIWDSK